MVHSLKSDSKYLGFTHLAELAYAHEMHSKEGDEAFVLSHYEELIEETKRILGIIKQYLGKSGSTENTKDSTSHSKKILVVDDSNIIRSLITKIFDDTFEVIPAKDGQEALRIVGVQNENHLYGVLLDLNMPNVNGFAVLEHFRIHNLFPSIPVAIITGDDSKETIEKAFTYPIVDVLTKPFNEASVKRVVTAMQQFHSV